MATFGKDDDGSNVQTFSGDRVYVCAGTPASGGTITTSFGRVRVTATGTTQARAVVFSDFLGEPLNFMCQSDEVVVDFTTSTNTEFPFSGTNQAVIAASTPYWIGFWFNDPGVPSFEMKRDNVGSLVRFATDAYPGGGVPTTPFVSGGTSNGPLNIAITYSETAAGGAAFFGYRSLTGVGL